MSCLCQRLSECGLLLLLYQNGDLLCAGSAVEGDIFPVHLCSLLIAWRVLFAAYSEGSACSFEGRLTNKSKDTIL